MIIHHSAFRMFLYTAIIMFLIMNCYTGQRVRFRYADSVSEFAFTRLLWLHFKNRTKNNILSPLSIYVSHACLMTGAEDETWYALARGLYLPSKVEPPKPYAYIVAEEVTEEFAALSSYYSGESSIISSNTLVLSDKMGVKTGFGKVTNKFTRGCCLGNHPNISRENFWNPVETGTIKRWVTSESKYMIERILDEPSSEEIKMVLLSTIYFKGIWNESFHPDDTRELEFEDSHHSKSKIPFMTKRSSHEHPLLLRYERDHHQCFEIIELPYKESISMFIILFHQGYHPKEWDWNFRNMMRLIRLGNSQPVEIEYLAIPKFKISKSYDMRELMDASLAYSNDADFPLLSDKKVKIGQSYHETLIEISEEGTNTAAATSIPMITKSSRSAGTRFVADHPFYFVICDRSNWMISFAGIINKLPID